MINNEDPVRLTPSMLPNSPNFDVKDSSFFRQWNELPSPEEVRTQAERQRLAGASPDHRKSYSMPYLRPPPVVFEDMNLFVKWGSCVRISEALGLFAVGPFLDGRVPVPEVYGWRTDADQIYMYMEHVQGQTLEQAWDTMEPSERVTICSELKKISIHLRRLQQDPSDAFVGNIVRSPLYDRVFQVSFMYEAGPFKTVRDFHNWFTLLHRRRMTDPYSVPVEPARYGLPDSCAIKFTHGDLHRSNIVVTPHRPYRILATVDWEQSGWLPAYWEVRKAQFTADRRESWSSRYLPIVFDQYTET